MGSRATGRRRAIERRHSLQPTHYEHQCGECGHFFTEFPDYGHVMHKNYCVKRLRATNSLNNACSHFTLRPLKNKKRKSEGERALDALRSFIPHSRDLIAQKMISATASPKPVSKIQAESVYSLSTRLPEKRKHFKTDPHDETTDAQQNEQKKREV